MIDDSPQAIAPAQSAPLRWPSSFRLARNSSRNISTTFRVARLVVKSLQSTDGLASASRSGPPRGYERTTVTRSPRLGTSTINDFHGTSHPRDVPRTRSALPGMSIATLNDIFFAIVDRAHERVMMHRQAIQWVPISSQELYRNVAGVSHALERWGIGKGDRVAILSENRPEWTIADFACQLLGIVSVPIYSTLTAEQSAFILKDAECRAVFVSSEQQLRKVQSARAQTLVEKIVVMDSVETNQAFHMAQLMHEGPAAARSPARRARAYHCSRRPRDVDLHIRHNRRFQGRDAHPRQSRLEHCVLAARIRVRRRARQRLVPATLAHHGAPR